MTIFESISEKFEQILYDQADPRIRNKPLMGSPLPVIAICIFYAFLIKVVMVKWMSARKAFKTRFLSLSLNSYLFSVSCYFLYKSSSLAWFKSYSWRCEPLDKSSSGDALEIAEHCYLFFLVKLSYMLETVVFMLGKKSVLVSKYHVFHHATLPILIWVVTNFIPGGHATFFALINSLVHMIVLGYFVTVTAFPRLKEHTKWWRSAFNWLHIGQFVIVIIHAAQLIFWNPCDFPMLLVYAMVIYGSTLLVLYISSWL